MKKITIVGQGFVGALMSVACARVLNKKKKPLYRVFGLEKNTKIGNQRVDSLNKGIFPFDTNDTFLKNELKKINLQNNFKASTNNKLLNNSDIYIVSINIDVSNIKSRETDILNFKKLIYNIGLTAKKNSLIIIESTLPPGFCEKIVKPILKKINIKKKSKKNIFLSYSYERVMPGKDYLASLIYNYRVFAADNPKAEKMCEDFLETIIDTKKYPLTKLKKITAAETAKILENTYRAVNIAFIDEWCKFAEHANIDLFEIINAIKKRSTHNNIRYPGLGVGGYCLTKDPLFANYSAKNIFKSNKNINFKFSNLSVKTNNLMPAFTCSKILRKFKTFNKKTFLIVGITYKSDVADTRQSPSKYLFNFIKKKGGRVICMDPYLSYWDEKKVYVEKNLKKVFKVDGIIFAVPHTKVKNINLQAFIKNKNTYILDANRCLSDKQKNFLYDNRYNFEILGSG